MKFKTHSSTICNIAANQLYPGSLKICSSPLASSTSTINLLFSNTTLLHRNCSFSTTSITRQVFRHHYRLFRIDVHSLKQFWPVTILAIHQGEIDFLTHGEVQPPVGQKSVKQKRMSHTCHHEKSIQEFSFLALKLHFLAFSSRLSCSIAKRNGATIVNLYRVSLSISSVIFLER
ncbi:hypothetical protein V6N11_034597 [Hibiscus sabdariffa]|uniref:Uncharacterized protein n=1 Tax=Hibiscus sabdariffa TaxID=183260 RepID=A0ABR2NDJ1_9ROSI